MEQQAETQTVTIGKQVWMKRNLDITTFRNGEPIFEAKNAQEWLAASMARKPACCCMEFDANYIGVYGRLYNWHAVNDPRSLAPEGWHIPNLQEWREIDDFLGVTSTGTKMKSPELWERGWPGTNESGFSALPGGSCSFGGGFIFLRQMGFWWGTDLDKDNFALTFALINNETRSFRFNYDPSLGQSVRCLKDL